MSTNEVTVLLSISFGIAIGLIAGFTLAAVAQGQLETKTVKSGVMEHQGKVYRLTEVHP